MVETVVGLANAEGGTLYVGINDDGIVSGVRTTRWRDPDLAAAYIASHTIPPVAVVAELVEAGEGLDVLVIEVSKATGIVATNDGKVLKRRLKIDKTSETSPLFPQEFISRLSEIGRCDYSSMILPHTSYADLDNDERRRLRSFIRDNRGDRTLLELEDEDLDKALGFVHETPHGLLPTVAGLLLIGKKTSIRRLVPGAGAVFQHLSGTEVLANEEIELPLLEALTLFLIGSEPAIRKSKSRRISFALQFQPFPSEPFEKHWSTPFVTVTTPSSIVSPSVSRTMAWKSTAPADLFPALISTTCSPLNRIREMRY